MNKSELISKVEKEEKERKEKERKEKEEERKKMEWRKKHGRQYWWQLKCGSDYKSTSEFAYAIWYYNKRFRLLNYSLIPFAIATLFLIIFIIHPSFGYYFLGATFVGLSRTFAPEGFVVDEEKKDYGEAILRKYQTFRLSKKDMFFRRFRAFSLGLVVAPICYVYHIYDYLEIKLHLDNPSPPVGIETYGSGEVEVGRIDQDGHIYKRT